MLFGRTVMVKVETQATQPAAEGGAEITGERLASQVKAEPA